MGGMGGLQKLITFFSGWAGLQKLITDLDMKNGYKEKGKITLSFASPDFFFKIFSVMK